MRINTLGSMSGYSPVSGNPQLCIKLFISLIIYWLLHKVPHPPGRDQFEVGYFRIDLVEARGEGAMSYVCLQKYPQTIYDIFFNYNNL